MCYLYHAHRLSILHLNPTTRNIPLLDTLRTDQRAAAVICSCRYPAFGNIFPVEHIQNKPNNKVEKETDAQYPERHEIYLGPLVGHLQPINTSEHHCINIAMGTATIPSTISNQLLTTINAKSVI